VPGIASVQFEYHFSKIVDFVHEAARCARFSQTLIEKLAQSFIHRTSVANRHDINPVLLGFVNHAMVRRRNRPETSKFFFQRFARMQIIDTAIDGAAY
jgi:hypothetical protein